MNNNKKLGFSATVQIINAIIWAVLMLFSSYMLQGSENFKWVLNVMIVGASLQLSLMNYILRREAPISKPTCI